MSGKAHVRISSDPACTHVHACWQQIKDFSVLFIRINVPFHFNSTGWGLRKGSGWRRHDALLSDIWKCFLLLLQGETVWHSHLERLSGARLMVPLSPARYNVRHTHTRRQTHTPFLLSTLLWLSLRILPLECNSEHTLPPWKNTAPNSSHLSPALPLILC